MKKAIVMASVVVLSLTTQAQKRTTTSATINFDATTAIDVLPKAENKTVIAALDMTKGTVAFEAAIKNFSFSNSMIQEHFNGKKWMDSDQYPTAIFKGSIVNFDKIDFNKDGTYTANVEGDLQMHGATHPVKTTATIVVNGKTMTATSSFTVKLADYNISGAAIGAGKVAAEPTIQVIATL